jgi:glyoxylase-like metal-dependent hydrolase (beta-lactamase superfamily II)
MSVLARLHGRELLITADAMYSRRSLTEDLHPLFYEDLHVYRRSLAEIRRYVEQTRNAVVIPGHDPESWPAMAQRFA